jgi:hypothetical protein
MTPTAFGLAESALELWLEYRPLKHWHPFRTLRNKRRARLGLPLLPTEENAPVIPQGYGTYIGIAIAAGGALLTPILVHFGAPASCPPDAPACISAASLSATLVGGGITLVGGALAWWGRHRAKTREEILKDAIDDLTAALSASGPAPSGQT